MGGKESMGDKGGGGDDREEGSVGVCGRESVRDRRGCVNRMVWVWMGERSHGTDRAVWV